MRTVTWSVRDCGRAQYLDCLIADEQGWRLESIGLWEIERIRAGKTSVPDSGQSGAYRVEQSTGAT